MDNLIFYIFFFGILAFIVYSVFTKGGKGFLFGGKIIETLNDSIIQKRGITKTTIKIHIIEKKQKEKYVGIELTENAKLSWSMKPVTISKEDAQKLVNMLNDAINKT